MISRQQNRTSTKYEVSFPDFPTFVQQPQWLRITQEQNKHDVIELSFGRSDSHFHKVLKTGALCKVTWRTEHASGEWYGHVYDGEETTQATMTRNFSLRGIGASFPLKEGGTKIWKNKTAPEIVQDICKEVGLKAVVDISAVRFSMQSLVGYTKWEKIQELAERIGFHVHVTGTTLYFQRIDSLIDQFTSVMPVMSYSDGSVNAGAIFHAQTLDQFKAKMSDVSDTYAHSKRTKVVNSIDPITGESSFGSSSPSGIGKNLRVNTPVELFQEVATHVVAESKLIAKELSKGLAQLGRFSNHATGKGQGDARIAPYRTIHVTGTGESTDGFWVIKKVEHFLTYDGRYTVEFSCMTDGIGKNKSDSAFRQESANTVPIRNLALELATGGKTSSGSTRIDARVPIVYQSQTGYTTTQRKWVTSNG